jgi:hypothetical protein
LRIRNQLLFGTTFGVVAPSQLGTAMVPGRVAGQRPILVGMNLR